MTTIENEYLKVSIREQGAELTSIFNKADNTEHLWQADASVWPWYAPNLFPIVGGCNDNQIHVDGHSYTLTRHGFTRESIFKLIESNPHTAKFSLKFNDDTLALYPYKFELQLIYDLIDNALRIRYKVINLDDKQIYFSVGGHPAFSVPFYQGESYEDYYLEFEFAEQLATHTSTAKGLLSGQTEPVATDENKLPLTKDMFANDALIFQNIKSKVVSIKSHKHAHSLTVEYPHFQHLGIWAKVGAPFVCIEPWLGYSDTDGKITEYKDKEAIQSLEVGHVFESDFFVSLSH